jgi:2-epi-5-epi-valiolone synthase
MSVIKDRELFAILEKHGKDLVDTKFAHGEIADEVINRAVQGMKEELEVNLWEKNLERIVDYGHSFSPIVEMRSINDKGQKPLTHGQAVCLDVIFSAVISSQRGMMSWDDVVRIARTAQNMLLPTTHALFGVPLVLLEALNDTMKHRNGNQNLPIPRGIGDPIFVNDLSFDEIKAASEGLKKVNVQLGAR